CTGSDCTGSDCTGSDCTGSDCTGSDCTGSDCTGSDCTGSDCTVNDSSANSGSSNSGSSNSGSTNNGSANSGSANSGSSNSGAEETSSSISAYAQKVVDLVNAERAKAGLSALQIDTDVTEAAQVRAKEIQTSFSHTRPDGRSCFTALDEAGAAYRGAGENIALGQKTPEQVMNDWMNSEGHRANILNGNFKYIGVGVDGNAWTQLFTY
ncbi:MAG: CAP domain-containing protein, partial [Anaerotignum sp.]|nr:CAP domain-containing protein [Anaerotignum sp.]